MREAFSLISFFTILLHDATSLIGIPDACDCSSFGGSLILIFLGDGGSTIRLGTLSIFDNGSAAIDPAAIKG